MAGPVTDKETRFRMSESDKDARLRQARERFERAHPMRAAAAHPAGRRSWKWLRAAIFVALIVALFVHLLLR